MDVDILELCHEFHVSSDSVRKMRQEDVDIVSLKLFDAIDLEEIGIPTAEAHMIVDSVTTKFFKISCINRERVITTVAFPDQLSRQSEP